MMVQYNIIHLPSANSLAQALPASFSNLSAVLPSSSFLALRSFNFLSNAFISTFGAGFLGGGALLLSTCSLVSPTLSRIQEGIYAYLGSQSSLALREPRESSLCSLNELFDLRLYLTDQVPLRSRHFRLCHYFEALPHSHRQPGARGREGGGGRTRLDLKRVVRRGKSAVPWYNVVAALFNYRW
jgi:hypothetical protein